MTGQDHGSSVSLDRLVADHRQMLFPFVAAPLGGNNIPSFSLLLFPAYWGCVRMKANANEDRIPAPLIVTQQPAEIPSAKQQEPCLLLHLATLRLADS